MYVIIVYDINVKRVNKVKAYLRKYLLWVQNSVFEGEITKSQLERIKKDLKIICNESEDSIIIYSFRTKRAMKRELLGIEKSLISEII